jgi:hypothetical protein
VGHPRRRRRAVQLLTVFTDDLVVLHMDCCTNRTNKNEWITQARARKNKGQDTGYPASIVRLHQLRSTCWFGSMLYMLCCLCCLCMSYRRVRRARGAPAPAQAQPAVHRQFSVAERRSLLREMRSQNQISRLTKPAS